MQQQHDDTSVLSIFVQKRALVMSTPVLCESLLSYDAVVVSAFVVVVVVAASIVVVGGSSGIGVVAGCWDGIV